LRVLITGASGFAGSWLARACADAGDEVVGLSRSGSLAGGYGEGRVVDLRDAAATRAAVCEVRPEVVYHLAAHSSVGGSWEHPVETVSDNVEIAAVVLEALRREAHEARVVAVSSCEVYGPPASLPVEETAPLVPANPYAVSKAAADLLAAVYAQAHGLHIIRARPFNHVGPGQSPRFVMSSIARQAAEARLAGATEVRIVIGNPDARRDFTDVRDVVRAYRLLAERAEPGVYNVSAGCSVSVAELVTLVRDLVAPVRVECEVDAARMRTGEVMELLGSHAQLTAATGWRPEIPLCQTVAETIAWWEEELTHIRDLSVDARWAGP
jgi:GDP-4-dehydro-6-deoxy-D-mannose reductase